MDKLIARLANENNNAKMRFKMTSSGLGVPTNYVSQEFSTFKDVYDKCLVGDYLACICTSNKTNKSFLYGREVISGLAKDNVICGEDKKNAFWFNDDKFKASCIVVWRKPCIDVDITKIK